MPRVIVHLDADAFFASVEQAADARLRGKPVAVGGEKRGIIASASYEARKFGVFTPMPTTRARKLCPKLIVVPGDYDQYEKFSRWMFSYAQDFTPDVEITSIDEGYFDLSGVRKTPLNVAQTVRDAIRQSMKISVSEGIGANKLVSQIASKLTKPAAFNEVPSGKEIDFLHPLPNRWLPGIGPQTAQRLNAAGLAYIRQVAATPLEMLHLIVGKQAGQLRLFANGVDERPVQPSGQPAKSYGQQQTFGADITDEEYAEAVLRRMAALTMRPTCTALPAVDRLLADNDSSRKIASNAARSTNSKPAADDSFVVRRSRNPARVCRSGLRLRSGFASRIAKRRGRSERTASAPRRISSPWELRRRVSDISQTFMVFIGQSW